MRRRSVYRSLVIAAVVILAAAGAAAEPAVSHAEKRHGTALVGSWLGTVSVAGGPTFKSLSTFTADGAWIMHDQGTVITAPPFPHVFSSGHGVWVQKGRRTFSKTALQLISDLNGNLLFINRIRQTLTIGASGDTYTAVWKSDFTDPAGNQVAAFEGTEEGRRITVQPLP